MDLVIFALGAAAVPCIMTVPAFLLLRRAGLQDTFAVAVATPATAAALAVLAAMTVALPWSTATTVRAGTAVLVVAAAWALKTSPNVWPALRARGGIVVTLLVYVSVAAFLSVPSRAWYGPQSFTLQPERAETPRLPGSSVDGHLPYRTAQLAVHKLGGTSLRDDYSAGWWISDRTPLVGLTFASVSSILGVDLPRDDPATRVRGAPMATVDDIGYWLYLLTVAWLGLSSLLALHALAMRYMASAPAMVGTALAGLQPGVFLYATFPRPSLALTPFALASVLSASQRRPVLAGVFLGLSYLAHPTGIWWAAPVGLVLYRTRREGRSLGGLTWAAAAAVLVSTPWQVFCATVVGGSSRMLAWPLGSTLSDPERPFESLSVAWAAFADRELAVNIAIRVSALTQSIFPAGLYRVPEESSPLGTAAEQAWAIWVNTHAFAGVGIAGLVLFGAALVGVVRARPALRRDVLALTGLLFAVGTAFEGFPESFFLQGMLGLSLIWALPAASVMMSSSVLARRALLIAATVEILSTAWGPGMFVPFGVNGAHVAAAVAVGVGGLCGLGLVIDRVLRSCSEPSGSRDSAVADQR